MEVIFILWMTAVITFGIYYGIYKAIGKTAEKIASLSRRPVVRHVEVPVVHKAEDIVKEIERVYQRKVGVIDASPLDNDEKQAMKFELKEDLMRQLQELM